MQISVTFPSIVNEKFIEKVAEANKKLQKYNADNLLEIISTTAFQRYVNINGTKISVTHSEVIVECNLLHTNKYNVIGMIQDMGNGSIFYSSQQNITHHENFICEHCNKKRARKEIFILEDKNTKNQISIGSTCINEFTGKNIQKILQLFFSFKATVETELNSISFSNFIIGERLYQTAINCHKANPVYNKADDYESTKAKVMVGVGCTSLVINTDEVTSLKEKLVSKFKNIDVKASNFNSNIYNSLFDATGNLNDFFTVSKIGLATWAIFDCLNTKEQKVENIKVNSNFVGNTGEKITKSVIIKNIKQIDSRYGVSNIIGMVDTEGNYITTITTASWSYDVSIGSCLNIVATVKEQKTFQSTKVTCVKNVKIF